jgi:hypothetical protein
MRLRFPEGIPDFTPLEGFKITDREVIIRPAPYPRRTQRKPIWEVVVSSVWGWRAAGR